MSTITLQLPPETERKLRDRAEREGQTVETLLNALVEIAIESEPQRTPRFISEPKLTHEEFRKLLDEIAASPPGTPLPPDFSREDIYYDHD
jgi:hypothetical protein